MKSIDIPLANKEFVSIIIPAFNEEAYIGDTIKALNTYPPENEYEIILVDNGSSDKTKDIATSLGARVIDFPKGKSIAAVRNAGVAKSKGDILIFIDADVNVTAPWQKEFTATAESLRKNPMQITGSRYLPPDNDNWLNVHWFSQLCHYEAPYINSGHLITSKTLFDKIEGFNESLQTAEDYDFCMKAKKIDAEIKNNPNLPVFHYGYPEDIKSFIKRERWHGKEDFKSLHSFLESKVALAAFANILLATFFIIMAISYQQVSILIIYFLLMFIVSFMLTLYKFDVTKVVSLPITSLIFFLYLTGRSLAFIDRCTLFFSPPQRSARS